MVLIDPGYVYQPDYAQYTFNYDLLMFRISPVSELVSYGLEIEYIMFHACYDCRFLSNTYTAPVPPSPACAEQNARIS